MIMTKDNGREDEPFEVIVGGSVESRDELARWEEAGVTRMISSPWRRSREALDGIKRYAELTWISADVSRWRR